MIEAPPPLFRSVPDDDTMNSHLSGILWFRSPNYFRDIEDIRADQLEGVGSYTPSDGTTNRDVSDTVPIQPTFILSFSEIPLSKYGKYVLKVQNPMELKRRVECRLPQKISEVEWRKIRYDKEMRVETDPGPGEGWSRKHYSKPRNYADEREWRLVIRFLHSFPILNQTLKLNFGKGNLVDIFELMPLGSETDGRD